MDTEMSLPMELLVQVLQIIGDSLPLKDVFAARRVNTFFADELTKRILRNDRLESEGFGCNKDETRRASRAWARCPKSLKMTYLRFKLDQHATSPSGFSNAIMELSGHGETQGVLPEGKGALVGKLLEGVTATYVLNFPFFVSGSNPMPTIGDVKAVKQSYEALLTISAVERGDNVEFARLVVTGANITEKCHLFQLTPIVCVAQRGTAAMASVSVGQLGSFKSPALRSCSMVFHISAANRNKAALKVWLAEMRKDPEAKPETCLQTELTRLAKRGDLKMLKFLLTLCNEAELRGRYKAFGHAVKGGFVECVKHLVNFPGFETILAEKLCSEHPLRLAMRCDQKEKRDAMIMVLLAAGFDLDVTIRPATKAELLGNVSGAAQGHNSGDVDDGGNVENDDEDDAADSDSDEEKAGARNPEPFMVVKLSQLHPR
ncbi:uncharacterized protein BDV17DRAFT_287395 [Aspergillus undulatus]|uniref:uncharacterized protein n=1 Tax=Aspergillus undulatus TaxID=1810928 RepID=UPI003CCDD3B5